MKLVQIICGCAGAETIEECARVPQELGAKTIVVHGLWPKIRYVTNETKHAYTELWANPTHHVDNVREVSKKNGWTFLQMNKFAYNGEQYNFALDYLEQSGYDYDHIWFVDSDECIDPEEKDKLLDQVELAKMWDKSQLRLGVRREILPGWKYIDDTCVVNINEGILWGSGLKARRELYFDGNYHFKSPVPYAVSDVHILHLHNLRSQACNRLKDGVFHSGDLRVTIADMPAIPETKYIKHLKEKYPVFYADREGEDSYVGSAIFDIRNNKQ